MINCPNCGESVSDDVPFCPACGQNLSVERRRRKLRFILMDVQEDRRFKHLFSAIIIAVVIMAVLAVVLTAPMQGDDDSPAPRPGPSDTAILVPGTSDYIELYKGFEEPGFYAFFQENSKGKQELHVALDSSISGKFSNFSWIVRNEVTGSIQVSIKDQAEIVWSNPSTGIFGITVACSTDYGDEYTHVGKIQYFGDSTWSGDFDYNGRMFSIQARAGLNEYISLASASCSRATEDAATAAAFVNTTDSVNLLAGRLQDAFLKIYPDTGINGPEFASFVLTYIQSCYREISDTASHSVETYWAFPGETIYTGQGDSEDLSVLAAAILKSSGYETGLLLHHGRTFLAIQSGYTAEDVPAGSTFISFVQDNSRYILCDPAGDQPLGCVDDAYGYRSGECYYYGEKISAPGFARA